MRTENKRPEFDALIEELRIPNPEMIDRELLTNALTHKSIKVDLAEKVPDNERLEFLGDAVLKLSVSQWLYQNYPDADEGVMSQTRAYVVSDKTLANIARKIRLGFYMILGKKETTSGGRNKESILANCLEAVFGTIFLCTGYNVAYSTIIYLLEEEIKIGISGKAVEVNSKDTLQKITQAKFKILPDYNTTYLEGPANKSIFQCHLKILENEYYAKGYSKKEAEQNAAKLALKDLQIEN
ncbi:MAG: ribonuclease III [Candidatus Sericytochromatia bacterium]